MRLAFLPVAAMTVWGPFAHGPVWLAAPPTLVAADAGRPAASPAARLARHKRVIPNLAGFDVVDPGMPGLSFTALGGTRGRPLPVPLAPRLGKVWSSRIFLSWSYPYLGGTFDLRVEQGGQVLFRGRATGNSFVLPADEVPITPGKTYYWAVEPASGAGSTAAPAGIQALAGSERTEVEKALAAVPKGAPVQEGLARAQVFVERRIWYDALATLSDLITSYPKEPDLFEQRGLLLSQFDWTKPAADIDFAQSDALRE